MREEEGEREAKYWQGKGKEGKRCAATGDSLDLLEQTIWPRSRRGGGGGAGKRRKEGKQERKEQGG